MKQIVLYEVSCYRVKFQGKRNCLVQIGARGHGDMFLAFILLPLREKTLETDLWNCLDLRNYLRIAPGKHHLISQVVRIHEWQTRYRWLYLSLWMCAKPKEEQYILNGTIAHAQLFRYQTFLGPREQHSVFWPVYKISPQENDGWTLG